MFDKFDRCLEKLGFYLTGPRNPIFWLGVAMVVLGLFKLIGF